MTTIKNPFEKSEIVSETLILLYPKKDATWEQMTLWLENAYSDPAWKWQGFGVVGTEGFKVGLIRRPGYDDEEDDEEDEEEDNDNGARCSRCKTFHCIEDDEHDRRLLFVSTIDDESEVCRGCIAVES